MKFDGRRIPVAVMGATGSVGQRFISLLADHPWFELKVLTASERSAGRPYGEAASWVQGEALPREIAGATVRPTTADAVNGCRIAFSALDASVAGEVESSVAARGVAVVSNAGSHRMDPDVPLIVPEVNPEHLALLDGSGPGMIVTNPNCSTIGLTLALKPLADRFGVNSVHVVTLQAVSGAGLPGLPSYHILDNVIPLIPGEEEKLQRESQKILGSLTDGKLTPHPIRVSAQCNRVPVIDGHTLCISVGLDRSGTLEEVRAAFEEFSADPQRRELPSAPRHPVHYREELDAPQPRLHRQLDGGMATAVGRLRPCPLLDWRFVALSHNTLRGAARGAILVAEQLVARGHISSE